MALTLGDNFSYQGAKPLDARLIYSTVASMKAVADSTMYDGCLAYCTATSKTYQWKSTNAVDETTGKWREFTSGGDTIQVDTLPTAGEDELGKVYQYIGSTTLAYTHGYFYECVSDGAGTPTYSWANVPTSKGGHDIKNDGVAVTSRDTMNFTDFDIADDSTNEETDIKAHRLTASELTDICSPLPSAVSDMPVLFDETGAEYVVGWYKLANGTKKPVYEKTVLENLQSGRGINVNTGITNIDIVVNIKAIFYRDWTGAPYTPDYCPPVYFDSTAYYQIGLKIDGKAFYNNDSNTTGKIYITAQYTKTTDTPV